jgi:hypothetical protein
VLDMNIVIPDFFSLVFSWYSIFLNSVFQSLLTVLGFELRASHLLLLVPHTSSPFLTGYFGNRVLLFAWTGLEPLSF